MARTKINACHRFTLLKQAQIDSLQGTLEIDGEIVYYQIKY